MEQRADHWKTGFCKHECFAIIVGVGLHKPEIRCGMYQGRSCTQQLNVLFNMPKCAVFF